VQVAPFIENEFLQGVQYYVFPTLGTSLLVIGTAYWLVWAKLLPAFGYHIQHEIVQMPDGSERVKYKVSSHLELQCWEWCLADVVVQRVKPKKRKKQGQWNRPRRQSVW
jgi:hypothetical protein